MGIVLAILGLGVTVVSPVLSLLLFVVIAPFETTYAFSAVDPRTYWAAALAARAACDQMTNGSRVPVRAEFAWGVFLAIAAVVIRLRGVELDPAEFEKARWVFRYLLAASFAAYAALQLCHGARDRRRLALAFSVSVAWVSAVSILQGVFLGEVARVTGPLGNPNYLAAFLGLSATVTLSLQAHGFLARRYAYGIVAFAWIGCVLTLSRVGLFSAVLGLILHRACTIPRARRLHQLLVSGLVIGAFSLVLAFYLTRTRAEIESAAVSTQQQKMARLGQAVSDLGRLQAALFAARLFTENPVFGAGFATFTARNYDENGIYLTTHNTYLQLLTGSGLLGALLLAIVIWQLLRSVPEGHRLYLLPVGACLCVNAASGDFLHSISTFVLLAIAYSAVLPTRPAVPPTDATARCAQ